MNTSSAVAAAMEEMVVTVVDVFPAEIAEEGGVVD